MADQSMTVKVAAGDVRMIMPCSEAAAAGRAAATQGRPTGGLDDTGTSTDAAEPSFLVVILSGFGVSSQAADLPEPRLTRQGTSVHAGEHSRESLGDSPVCFAWCWDQPPNGWCERCCALSRHLSGREVVEGI